MPFPQMTIFASLSLCLFSLLSLSVPLHTHAQEECVYCKRLPRCRRGDNAATVEDVWNCMTDKFGDEADPNPPVDTIDALDQWCCEVCPEASPDGDCEHKPSSSPVPTMRPTVTSKPTGSPNPTPDCVCCDCIKTCNINPDPHFMSWDNNMYDFQGGCDMYAVLNDELEIQIATRPRNYYSTITQITVVWNKPLNEFFKISFGGSGPTVNTITTDATVSNSGSTWTIAHTTSPSFIRITNNSNYGLTLQVQGHGTLFSDSVGMCGNWNYGGVRFVNGSLYDTSGGYSGTAATSFPLAQDWQIPFADNDLVFKTNNCDASSSCDGMNVFSCSAVRRLLKKDEAHPGCGSTCDDLTTETSRLACEQDVALTSDGTWACQKSYQDPLMSYQIFCEYCNRLELCLDKSELNDIWTCLITEDSASIPYGIATIADLTEQCEKCTCDSGEESLLNEFVRSPIRKKGRIRDCEWLNEKKPKDVKRICGKYVDYWKDPTTGTMYRPPQKACPVTCRACDSCFENPKTKYTKRVSKQGKAITGRCGHLKNLKSKASICSRKKKISAYPRASKACPQSCEIQGCDTSIP